MLYGHKAIAILFYFVYGISSMWLLTGLFVLLTHYIGYWCPYCYKCKDCPRIGRSNLWCSCLYVPSYPLLTKHYISKKMKEKKNTRGSSPCLCLVVARRDLAGCAGFVIYHSCIYTQISSKNVVSIDIME